MTLRVNLDHLPRTGKPTDILKVAMADLEAAEKAEGVKVDMGQWHYREAMWKDGEQVPAGPCHVCLAGAAMRGMGIPDNLLGSFGPEAMPEAVRDILYALDYFRSGEFNYMSSRFEEAGIPCDIPDDVANDCYVRRVGYNTNPGEFKRWAYETIAKLEAAGL